MFNLFPARTKERGATDEGTGAQGNDYRDTDPSHLTELSPLQRAFLLDLAHKAIASEFSGEPVSEQLPQPAPDSMAQASAPIDATQLAALQQPRGVFTTLYIQGQLRGCVGYALASAPLIRAVIETARAAAFDDSRFSPVTAAEVQNLKVSLSVLSPLFPVRPDQVEIGRHGLLISQGNRRGLLLPQVPTEHGWDRETFLEQTCRKAGLPLDAWRHGATTEAFVAEVFSDDPALT